MIPKNIEKSKKVQLMKKGYYAVKNYDEVISQVTVNYLDEEQNVLIANSNGLLAEDNRVRTRMGIQAVASRNGEMQVGFYGPGALMGFEFYDRIDIDFFVKTWPCQGIKMTLSEYSLAHLADNIKHAHSLGFCEIGGVNLFEGTFDWSDEKYIRMLIPQLEQLVDFYVENDNLRLDQMMNRKLEMCEEKNRPIKKWC